MEQVLLLSLPGVLLAHGPEPQLGPGWSNLCVFFKTLNSCCLMIHSLVIHPAVYSG
jgi:hypothetical protein